MTDALEHRVTRLEDGVDRLSINLSDHTIKLDEKLDGIASLLSTLVRVEERQSVTSVRLAEGSETMTKYDERIKAIEIVIPGLLEKSKWTVMAVAGVIGIVAEQVLVRVFH